MKRAFLITGASAGLGTAYAKFINKHYNNIYLVLVARRLNRLEEISTKLIQENNTNTIITKKVDLLDSNQRLELYNYTRLKELFVEYLINNAGYGSVTSFIKSDIEWELNMVDLNIKAIMHLTHLYLQDMTKKQCGNIINISSTASFQPMPYMATYGATKSFVSNWTVALSSELQKSKVKSIAICPGPTNTEFHLVAGLPEKMTFIPAMTAEKVVEQTFNALKRNKVIYVNGILNRFLANLNRLFSKKFASYLVEKTLRRKAK